MNAAPPSSRLVRVVRWSLLGGLAGIVLAVLEAILNWYKFGFLLKGNGIIDLMQGLIFAAVFALVGTVAGAVLGFVLGARPRITREQG